jgi:hypothetical protein
MGAPQSIGEQQKEGVAVREALGSYRLSVRQPPQVKDLINLLEMLEGVTERVTASKGASSIGQVGAQGGEDDHRESARYQALANLPDTPLMQKRLVSSLEREVTILKRQARKAAFRLKRGGAFVLNNIYAKIRKIKAMIAEILSATREVVERLYVRLFVDGQPIV